MEPAKYKVLTRTFRKAGENTAALTASLLTPVVPSDGQKKIEEKTGFHANDQTFVSGVVEYAMGFLMLPYGSPLAIGMMVDGAGRMICGHNVKTPTASIPLEVTYRAGKYLYKKGKQYFSSLYREAKQELEKELL